MTDPDQHEHQEDAFDETEGRNRRADEYEESFEVLDDALIDEAQAFLDQPHQPGTEPPRPAYRAADNQDDDSGDMGLGGDEAAHRDGHHGEGEADWENELSTPRIAAELRRIEQEIRSLLEARDPRRKRKFAGTRRWFELEEDIIALRYTGRIEEAVLTHIQLLTVRRHHLFRRLNFLASTRPSWNS